MKGKMFFLKNYALQTMSVEEGAYNSAYHDPYAPGAPSLTLVTVDPGLTKRDGQDATYNDLRKTNFWLDTEGLSFNFDNTGTGIGKFVNIWNFSDIVWRGHPKLVWE